MRYFKFKRFVKKYFPLIYYPEFIILKLIGIIKYKEFIKCWIISERKDEAKDNGYFLFNYINTTKVKNNSFYIIDESCNDYKKIKNKKNVINYGSYKHKIAYILSEAVISTHYHSMNPWKYCDIKTFNSIYFRNKINKKTTIFLQHGIIYNDVSDYLGKENTNFDLFICGARVEYEYIKRKFGYKSDEVVYTGLSRFDNLLNKKYKKQILFMPTWRKYLSGDKNKFIESDYFKNFQSLINSTELIKLLEKYDYQLVFYPHSSIQNFIECFSSNNKRVIIANKNCNDIQNLLIKSKLLITDYSSVFFDFAFMKKPIIYYQFDKEEFFKNHYKQGYFNFENNGFGNVVTNEESCINTIKIYFENNFHILNKYEERIDDFFELRDSSNNYRIIKQILYKLENNKIG